MILSSIGYIKLPPKASLGRGHPIVWTTLLMGVFTSQSSLTPNAYICGLGDVMFCQSRKACVRGPLVPSARTVTLAVISIGGTCDPWTGMPSEPNPDGVVLTPTTFWSCTNSPSAGKPGNILIPSCSAFSPIHLTTSQMDAT